MNPRVVVMNGDVHVNVRPLVPDVTLQFPQECITGHSRRMDGLKKSTSMMPS